MIPLTFDKQKAAANIKKEYKLARPFVTPAFSVTRNGMAVKLWIAQRKLPFLMAGAPFQGPQALVVPVAPDLKMVYGVAKMARDMGANFISRAAEQAAPLPPGEAFIGMGSRYRYKYTVLAVVFDEQKRSSPEVIVRAVRRGAELARQHGCTGLIMPDFTESLIAQPNWITPERRRETAEIVALATVEAIRACRGLMQRVHVWCWDEQNAALFLRELKRL